MHSRVEAQDKMLMKMYITIHDEAGLTMYNVYLIQLKTEVIDDNVGRLSMMY
ncbi:MAG: hypothetical protein J6S85_24645 [Methanobrevibacter sp.]|nr:hypothetical protein [Methanobrevibacter sp.]